MWWQALGGLAISALSLAAGAGWISTSTGRRLNRIEAHLDIIDKLDDGAARQALRARTEDEVLAHVAALDSATVRRWARIGAGFAVASLVVGVVLAVLVVLVLFGRTSGWVLVWTSAGGILLALLANAVMNRAQRAIEVATADEELEHRTETP